MTWYRHQKSRLTDREIELLLSGSPEASDEHADVKWFLGALASATQAPPSDPGPMATELASAARTARPTDQITVRPQKVARRMVALAASVGLLFAMSGIALAADGSAPGDFLYGVDRAFEMIGVGDGGVDERIAEFDELVARGDDERAHELIEEFIESAARSDAAKAQDHLEASAADPKGRAEVAMENVSDQKQFIKTNQKNNVGADGKDFGQGVADLAKDKELPDQANGNKPETPANDETPNGPPENAGPKTDTPADTDSGDDESTSNGNPDPGPPDDPGNGNNDNTNNGNGNSNGGINGNGNNGNGPPDNPGKGKP